MRASLILLFLILLGCTTYSPVEFAPENYPIYSYYLQEEKFHCSYDGPVQIRDSIPPLSLTVGDQWHYQNLKDSVDTNATHSARIILLSLDGKEANFLVNGLRRTVFLEEHYYSEWIDGSSPVDSIPAPYPLPIPHKSQLLPTYESPCLLMGDGSYAYKVDGGCYSSRFGLIQSDPCLYSYNSSSHEPIALLLNEFNKREELWFQ